MESKEKEILKQIAGMGMASEVELQAKTLLTLEELEEQLKGLEGEGLIRRKAGLFGRHGDGLELTPKGYNQSAE